MDLRRWLLIPEGSPGAPEDGGVLASWAELV